MFTRNCKYTIINVPAAYYIIIIIIIIVTISAISDGRLMIYPTFCRRAKIHVQH